MDFGNRSQRTLKKAIINIMNYTAASGRGSKIVFRPKGRGIKPELRNKNTRGGGEDLMNKSKIIIPISIFAILFTASLAMANPFTFEVTQDWSFNADSSIFGSAADLLITVDNGNSSEINQSYTWQDITDIVYKTVGGTFYLDAATENTILSTTSVQFLTTDSSGSGTLDINNSSNVEYYEATPSLISHEPYAQLSTLDQNLYNIYYTVNNTTFAFFDQGGGVNWSVPATLVGGSSPVSEPTTMLLFGAGMVGLAGTKIRRKKKA